jgi:hypothetical protein
METRNGKRNANTADGVRPTERDKLSSVNITIRLGSLALLGAAFVCLTSCKPEFTSTGSLSIDGKEFVPTSCRVLAPCTGIELTNAAGASVQLTLPPARLDAFEDVSGSASLSYMPGPGATAIEGGACGRLTMTGEGYHGGGKRAASGQATLACEAPVKVSGDIKFEGCF